MEKKNIVVKSEKKLNVSYNEFIKKLVESKLDIKEVNKEDIIKLYREEVKLKFNNIKRVYNRNLREENKDKLSNELKRLNISEKEFKEISNKVIELSKEVKINNYI